MLSNFCRFMILAAALLPAQAVAQSRAVTVADLPARIMACSRQADSNSLRLRCFDETAMAVEEMTREASVRSQFAWSVRSAGAGPERKTTISIASTEAIAGTDTISKKNSFFLAGSCMAGQTNFYIAFPDAAYSSAKEVVLRHGQDEKSTVTLYPSESGKAMGIWNNDGARTFITDLSDMPSVSFEFPDPAMPVTISFDLRGMSDAVHAMTSACRV